MRGTPTRSGFARSEAASGTLSYLKQREREERRFARQKTSARHVTRICERYKLSYYVKNVLRCSEGLAQMTAARDVCYRNELGRLTPTLRQFGRALVQDQAPETADDLVQASLVRALACDQRRHGERLLIWLLGTMTNLHRSQCALLSADHQVTAGSRHTTSGATLSRGWDLSRPRRRGAASALGELPVECREVLLLATLAKLSYPQIAETLAVSISTVLTRLSSAREQLERSHFGERMPQAQSRPSAGCKVKAVPYLRVVK